MRRRASLTQLRDLATLDSPAGDPATSAAEHVAQGDRVAGGLLSQDRAGDPTARDPDRFVMTRHKPRYKSVARSGHQGPEQRVSSNRGPGRAARLLEHLSARPAQRRSHGRELLEYSIKFYCGETSAVHTDASLRPESAITGADRIDQSLPLWAPTADEVRLTVQGTSFSPCLNSLGHSSTAALHSFDSLSSSPPLASPSDAVLQDLSRVHRCPRFYLRTGCRRVADVSRPRSVRGVERGASEI